MILAVDIGTSFLKTALTDRNGAIVKISEERLRNRFSEITNTSEWERAFACAVSALDLGSNGKDSKLDCIIISGNGPTLAPSSGGKVFLYTFSDAVRESEHIKEVLGVSLSPAMFLPKALYIKRNEPMLWRGSEFFMSSPEYLSFKLTGVPGTILSLEGLEKWYWKDEWLEALEIEKEKFPPFIRSGEFWGRVNAESAVQFGLKEGTPVLAGAPDFVPAIIGSGAMHVGMVCNRSGSSEGINYCSAEKTEEPFYMCYQHPNKTDWNISAVIPRGFLQIDSAKEALGFANLSYAELFQHIEKYSDPASQRMKEACRGLCMQIKTLLDKVSNGKADEIRIGGAPAKYRYFNQMRADVTRIRVTTVDSPECGLSGLAIMALSSLEKEDIASAADRMVKVGETFYPE